MVIAGVKSNKQLITRTADIINLTRARKREELLLLHRRNEAVSTPLHGMGLFYQGYLSFFKWLYVNIGLFT